MNRKSLKKIELEINNRWMSIKEICVGHPLGIENSSTYYTCLKRNVNYIYMCWDLKKLEIYLFK